MVPDSSESSMAFEPTPAIPEAGKENGDANAGHDTENPMGEHVGRPTKEVHFSSIPSLPQRAQSLATTVPFLEPISSASSLPKQSRHSKPQIDMNAYIEQSRALLDIQRKNFERERKTFEAERKLWDAERKMLLLKIADLELKSNQKLGNKRRYSNEHPSSSVQTFRSNFGNVSNFSSSNFSKQSSAKSDHHPVWETPDMAAVVTRVFPPETDKHKSDQHLPSIAESGISPTLDGALSPNRQPGNQHHSASVSIPIERLDSSLDGINLKSTALPPSIVAKVISPSEISPNSHSPGSRTPTGVAVTKAPQVPTSLLIPSPPNLKTNAGHTPLAFEGSVTVSEGPSDVSTPIRPQELSSAPAEPRPVRPPTERADSYFPDISPQKSESIDTFGAHEPLASAMENEDKELKGPLTMESDHKEGSDNAFLSELDAKLLMEAKRIISPQSDSTEPGPDDIARTEGDDLEDGPRLRLKKSTNFGSAFGSSDCGTFR